MPTVWKSGSLNLLEPTGSDQVCNGIALPLLGTLLPIPSSTPSSVQVHVFDGDIGSQVNLRCCSMDGLDEEIVASIQRVPSHVNLLVEMCLRADEFIRNQELLSVRMAIHKAPGSRYVNT
jgi:hypothetical protein